jgi:hypothetical protein
MDTLKRKMGRPPGPGINQWITGPNPQHHQMYVAFGYSRVSARLRGDGWDLPWETWRDTWLPVWDQRGRGSANLCMARLDIEKPWAADNIEILTRRQAGQRTRRLHQ